MRPLDGIRIVDLTHVPAGPYATEQLALMGADVLRFENPAGSDFIRFTGGTDQMRRLGLAPAFLSQNAGKRSVALDEVPAHPRTAASPSSPELDVPEIGRRFRVPGLAFRAPWRPDRLDPVPALGRDTRAVLRALGRDDAEIDPLIATGVPVSPPPAGEGQGGGADV